MAKTLLVWIFSAWLAFPPDAGAQGGSLTDKDVDFPSIGPPPAELQSIPQATASSYTSEPTKVQQSIPSPEFGDLPHLFIPEPETPHFTSIPSPVIPPLPTIASPVVPRFPDIPSPELKFTEFKNFEKIPGVASLRFSKKQFSAETRKIISPSLAFIPETGEGGGRTGTSGISSTSLPSPLTLPSFGPSSTPLPVFTPQNILSPYIWGQSSTPIPAPLAPQLLIQNPQTPYVWGFSSTPVSSPTIPNILTPYVWGKSSTPTPRAQAAASFGASSTPHGQSSAPHGQSSTPGGGSSTPHGPSSTPQGPSSTPRTR